MADGPNVDGLREFYKKNAVARWFLDHAAQRERGRAETSVERTQGILKEHDHEVSRGDIVDLYQALEKLNCGKFIPGRRGRPSRFAWTESIVSVGKAAAGEPEVISSAPEPAAAAVEVSETLTHAYHLRPDTQVTIELPTDLSLQEAERLAAFIKTLPMEQDGED
jgi:hypothetical protein